MTYTRRRIVSMGVATVTAALAGCNVYLDSGGSNGQPVGSGGG